MKITDLRFNFKNDGRLKAFVNITFDNCFVVKNAKIVQLDDRQFLGMPSRQMPDGEFKDVAFPINAEYRAYLEQEIFAAYEAQRPKGPAAGA